MVLEPYSNLFRSACSKAYGLHAEMQLVDHFNTGGAQCPTIDYFGCSKKSCFLCESFLQSLPSPVGTRGRHGICYPAWGIPCPTSTESAVALDNLKGILVAKIKSCLRNETGRLLAAVPQSTLVPEVPDSVFQQLSLQETMARKALNETEDVRKQQRIL
jgi:hypothetical protein